MFILGSKLILGVYQKNEHSVLLPDLKSPLWKAQSALIGQLSQASGMRYSRSPGE